jgi:hypothetical protein
MKENFECNDCGARYESYQELCRVCGGELTPLVDWQSRALKAEAEVERLRGDARAVIDALCLRGHSASKEWNDLCLLVGRYCEPFLSEAAPSMDLLGDRAEKAEAERDELKVEIERLRDRFEQSYATRSGVTVEWLREHGQHVVPCDCDDPGCPGWAMSGTTPESESEGER